MLKAVETDRGELGRREGLQVASTVRCSDHEGPWAFSPGTAGRGSVIAARVVRIGAYDRIETRTGREVQIRQGDTLVGVIADRFSGTSLYGVAPHEELAVPGSRLDLLSIGGVIGQCKAFAEHLGPPTRLETLAVVTSAGVPLRARAVPTVTPAVGLPPLVLVVGSAAEVGKTTFACSMIHRLSSQLGLRVAAGKLTGTGRLRDILAMSDAGAVAVLDFVSVGLPTTYGISSDLVRRAAGAILESLTASQPDLLVAELGGDVLGGNADALLSDRWLQEQTTVLVVVASDVVASFGARRILEQFQWTRPILFAAPRRNPLASSQLARRILDCSLIDPTATGGLDSLIELCLGTPSPVGPPRPVAGSRP